MRPSDGQDMRGRHGNHVRGSAHPRWHSGTTLSDDGYVKVQVGRSHPLADPNGYAYLHLLVWVAAGNPRPSESETLHHIDEDKQVNRIDNLELLTRSDHAKRHDEERGRDGLGRFPVSPASEVLR